MRECYACSIVICTCAGINNWVSNQLFLIFSAAARQLIYSGGEEESDVRLYRATSVCLRARVVVNKAFHRRCNFRRGNCTLSIISFPRGFSIRFTTERRSISLHFFTLSDSASELERSFPIRSLVQNLLTTV